MARTQIPGVTAPVYKLWYGDDPWGDYGRILVHGTDDSAWDPEALPVLLRTGPFVPPITQPKWRVVVRQDLKEKLERSGLTGFRARPIVPKRVIRVEWERWDRTKERPRSTPRVEEPEDYLFEGRHSARTAAEMPQLWELQLAGYGSFKPPKNPTYTNLDYPRSRFVLGDGPMPDWFRPLNIRYTFVSQRTKEFLEKEAGEWVSFFPLPVERQG